MTGYQADLGPGYWGSLYDESRHNKILAAPDSITLQHGKAQVHYKDITLEKL